MGVSLHDLLSLGTWAPFPLFLLSLCLYGPLKGPQRGPAEGGPQKEEGGPHDALSVQTCGNEEEDDKQMGGPL